MKLFVATLMLTAFVAVQGKSVQVSPAVPLKDYLEQHPGEGRIISGANAKPGQFPWQVALNMHMSGGGGAFCGGSLISPQWVLTAAHCVQGVSSWTVSLGATRVDVNNEPGVVKVSTSNGFTHERYNQYLNNDIALIKLPSPVQLSDTIQVIRLPGLSEVNNRLENVKLTVSGWGKTSDSSNSVSPALNYVELTSITNAKCAQVYGSQTIISSTICCVGNPQHSPCNGDSGGPLIRVAEDGKPTQVAVVSFVHSRGCASGNPSGYVRTASFLEWINKNTGIAIRP